MWPPRSGNRGGGGSNGQIVSIKRAADGRRQRSRKIIDKKRKNYRVKNGSLRNTSTDSKQEILVILRNHASVPIRKKIESNEQSKEGTIRNKFKEKGFRGAGKVKYFREINNRQNHPRSRPEFVIPIRDVLSKEENLI